MWWAAIPALAGMMMGNSASESAANQAQQQFAQAQQNQQQMVGVANQGMAQWNSQGQPLENLMNEEATSTALTPFATNQMASLGEGATKAGEAIDANTGLTSGQVASMKSGLNMQLATGQAGVENQDATRKLGMQQQALSDDMQVPMAQKELYGAYQNGQNFFTQMGGMYNQQSMMGSQAMAQGMSSLGSIFGQASKAPGTPATVPGNGSE